jgi:ferredoxin-nitrite reductase
MRELARIAERFGSGTIRLTVWQNLLISDIPRERVDEVKHAIDAVSGSNAPRVNGVLAASASAEGVQRMTLAGVEVLSR